jgi:hypothetical protein
MFDFDGSVVMTAVHQPGDDGSPQPLVDETRWKMIMCVSFQTTISTAKTSQIHGDPSSYPERRKAAARACRLC